MIIGTGVRRRVEQDSLDTDTDHFSLALCNVSPGVLFCHHAHTVTTLSPLFHCAKGIKRPLHYMYVPSDNRAPAIPEVK